MRVETIGDCQLYLGDCLEVLPEIPGADCVIADPPYFMTLSNDVNTKLNPWANLTNGAFFIKHWLELCLNKLPEDCAIWSFTNWQGFAAFQKAGMEAGAPVRSLLVWDKDTLGPGNIGLRPTYELVALFVRGAYRIQDRSLRDIFKCIGGRYVANTHPAKKPVPLLEHLINISGNRGEIVLDPFMGSGSTGVAAVKSGRAFIGIEMDGHWFDVACKRIESAYQESEEATNG